MTAQLFEIGPGDVALTSDDWYTPRWLFDAAGLTFDMDVCAPVNPAFRTCPAKEYLTVVEDGLAQPWHGIVWMNPPFSNPTPWVDRWAQHSSGLALLPAANSRWRERLLVATEGIALISMYCDPRMRTNGGYNSGFLRADGSQVSYPTALILAARGEECISSLERVARVDTRGGGAFFVRSQVTAADL